MYEITNVTYTGEAHKQTYNFCMQLFETVWIDSLSCRQVADIAKPKSQVCVQTSTRPTFRNSHYVFEIDSLCPSIPLFFQSMNCVFNCFPLPDPHEPLTPGRDSSAH